MSEANFVTEEENEVVDDHVSNEYFSEEYRLSHFNKTRPKRLNVRRPTQLHKQIENLVEITESLDSDENLSQPVETHKSQITLVEQSKLRFSISISI
jgi:hypothetical protein